METPISIPKLRGNVGPHSNTRSGGGVTIHNICQKNISMENSHVPNIPKDSNIYQPEMTGDSNFSGSAASSFGFFWGSTKQRIIFSRSNTPISFGVSQYQICSAISIIWGAPVCMVGSGSSTGCNKSPKPNTPQGEAVAILLVG